MELTLELQATLQNGKYQIIKVLGQGGFGITYLANHTTLGKKIAIKEFFPKDYCNRDGSTSHISIATTSNRDLVDKLRDRFVTEARNISMLNHPDIVKIHDIFEENGTAYYVMDYIEGISLDEYVKSYGAMSESTAVEYACRIAGSLEYIHNRRITHFDIKPANIMLSQPDMSPVLIDFGLSKQYNDQGHAYSTLLLGLSHGYSPLEQYFQDGISGFSPQSDIYSLAATLYTMLSGRIPPEAPKLTGSPIELPVNISREVADVVKWGMASNIPERCQDAKSFREALQVARLGESCTIISGVGSPSTMVNDTNSAGYIHNSINRVDNSQFSQPLYYEANHEPQKKSSLSAFLIGSLAGLAILGAGIAGYYLYKEREPEQREDPYVIADHRGQPDVVDTRSNTETPAAEEVEEYTPASSQFGTFKLTGEVDGQYPIQVVITCTETSDGCHVEGKYAYNSTLRKYGNTSSNWFYFSGNGDSDGSNISWTETTPSDSEFEGYFRGSFINGVLDGTTGSMREDSKQCHVYATN